MVKINNASAYGEVRSKPLKPDKLALKNKLYKDRDEIAKKILETQDLIEKNYLKNEYYLIDSYSKQIVICDDYDFNSVKGMLYLPVYAINGKGDLIFKGNHNRWLDVHFTKVAFKGVPNECDIHSPEDLSTGTLYVRLKGIQTPSKYVVTKDEDRDDIYPEIWVKHSVVGFVPYTPDKDVFKYHKSEKYIENEETGEITQDDPDTNPFTDGE